MKNMAVCNYFVSLLGLVAGGLIMQAAAEFPLEFTVNGPGAGFWPFILGALLAIMGVWLFIYTFINREFLSREEIALALPANKRVYMVMALTAVYCVLIALLGFYPASAALIPALMRLLDCRGAKTIALTTVGTVVFIYLVFGEVLHTQMPQSIFLE